MTLNEPYFMTNTDWYYFDEKEMCYKLTDDAPEKARESYKDFYNDLKMMVEDDVRS